MKIYFAGLMLFASLFSTAQTTTTNCFKYTSPYTNSSIQKIRTVLLWDAQHNEQANNSLRNPIIFSRFILPASNRQLSIRINYVEQHASALSNGISYGLLLAKSFTKYGNTPSTNLESMRRYYNINAAVAGQGNANALFGGNLQNWPYRQ